MARGTRPRQHRIEVWCDEEEFARIKAAAKATMLSTSEYLRSLGQGDAPKSAFDSRAIGKLARLHADQVRLAGLLKLCLSDKGRQGTPGASVRSVLHQIESLQTEIAGLISQEARHL